MPKLSVLTYSRQTDRQTAVAVPSISDSVIVVVVV